MLEVQDHYFTLAKKEGYVARSAYKLQEIDQKFGFFGSTTRTIVDIGCAPGSRLQYASRQLQKFHTPKDPGGEELENSPKIVGFDLKEVSINLPFVKTFIQDITERDAVTKIINQEFTTPGTHQSRLDLIVSDMAPDTTSDPSTDALRSSHMIKKTLRLYEELLQEDGKFAIKVFMGPGFEELVKYCRDRRGSKAIKIFKPKSCRKESKETYIIKI